MKGPYKTLVAKILKAEKYLDLQRQKQMKSILTYRDKNELRSILTYKDKNKLRSISTYKLSLLLSSSLKASAATSESLFVCLSAFNSEKKYLINVMIYFFSHLIVL